MPLTTFPACLNLTDVQLAALLDTGTGYCTTCGWCCEQGIAAEDEGLQCDRCRQDTLHSAHAILANFDDFPYDDDQG